MKHVHNVRRVVHHVQYVPLQRTHIEEQYFSTARSVTQGPCQFNIIQNQIHSVNLICV